MSASVTYCILENVPFLFESHFRDFIPLIFKEDLKTMIYDQMILNDGSVWSQMNDTSCIKKKLRLRVKNGFDERIPAIVEKINGDKVWFRNIKIKKL